MPELLLITACIVFFANAQGTEVNQLSDLTSDMYRIEALVMSQAEKLEAVVKTQAALSDKLETLMEQQDNSDNTSMVAFSAYRATPAQYGPGETIIFPAYWTNLGDAYDINTGIFTCPFAGLYYFSYAIYIKDASRIDIQLVREGTLYAAAYAHDTDYDQGAISLIIPCNAEDQVWLRQASSHSSSVGEITKDGACIANSFTGFLLYQIA